MKNYNFWFAVATLVGGTVGVGIFGIPFVFVKAGLLPGLLFLVGLTLIVILLNMMYGEIVLRTSTRHLLLGYTHKYLGHIPKNFLLLTYVLSGYGAMLAYIIIAGTFLENLFSFFAYLSPTIFSTLFFLAGAVIILIGIRAVSRFDLLMLVFFVILIFSIALFSAKEIDINNYVTITNEFWFLPFGVIFFAMSGLAAIPLAWEALNENSSSGYGGALKLKPVLFMGTIIPAILYLIFGLTVMGVSGESTSPDAISGLAFFLGPKVALIGSIFGILAVSTSFIGMGLALRESFQDDFQFSRFKSWLIVVIPPYILFLLGLRNFIEVIGLVGGLALSVEGIFLLFLYMKARRKGDRVPEYSINIPRPVIYLLMAVFVFAAVYTLVT